MTPIADFDAQVIRSGKPTLVYFGADWCGYCRLLHPRLDELAECHPEYAFYEVDADRYRALVREHRVRGLPTCLVFKNGRESGRVVGAEPDDVYLSLLREPLARCSDLSDCLPFTLRRSVSMKYATKAIDWATLKQLFDMLQQFGPILVGFLTTVIDLFKKKEMQGVAEADYGDCCPEADALADEIVAESANLQSIVVRLKADPCNEAICKEYMQALACLVSKGLKLHACHED